MSRQVYNSLKFQADPLSENIARFSLTTKQYARLLHPKTLLISLYHPENFPLPRFALGISDMARALRKSMLGSVHLLDMQLTTSIGEIIEQIIELTPNIIGISATFGQHDILMKLSEALEMVPGYSPIIIAGGSLAVLNKSTLLHEKTARFVANGAGENTIQDIAKFVLGDIAVDEITDVSYLDENGVITETNRLSNRDQDDILPELDLLAETLAAGGVMQLESSRGCSYACSFCPRTHKGIWAGEAAAVLGDWMPEVSAIFEKLPQIERRIFLVDEEFVGYEIDDLSLSRCLDFAKMLREYGFRFETSSRIDQVVRNKKDKDWHVRRLKFWSNLNKTGMDRCLFGVESGVDSILARFNKKTTAEQNVLAIRSLTSIGLPIRITYITFDPLMSLTELVETYQFLGRYDMILNSQSNLDFEAIYYGVRNDEFVARNLKSVPFYHYISYMLVSMEALIGSPYLKMVESEGLAGKVNKMMGRREVTYRDKRVGRISDLSQRWIDRNFSLDYLLKSLEKISDSVAGKPIKTLRLLFRDAAYELLGLGLKIFCGVEIQKTHLLVRSWFFMMDNVSDIATINAQKFLNQAFSDFSNVFILRYENLRGEIKIEHQKKIDKQLDAWLGLSDWGLINGYSE